MTGRFRSAGLGVQFAGQVQAGHAGHLEIGDQQIDGGGRRRASRASSASLAVMTVKPAFWSFSETT